MKLARCCRAAPGPLLDGVAVGPDPISRLSPFALAQLARRAACENRSSVGFWRAVSLRATEISHLMQPADMSTLLFGFARMRFRDKGMMNRFADAIPAILGQFRAAEIARYLGASARLDIKQKLVLNLFARESARKLHDFTAAELGELVYAYARLEMKHDLLIDVLKKRIVEVLRALKPWHLAMITNGFARLSVADERVFTLIAAEIARKITEFSGRPLALVANAYARMQVRNQILLTLISEEAFRKRGELEPQSVALMLNAHARLLLQSPVLFDYCSQDVPRQIGRYPLQAVCMVASAFARQRRADEQLFEKIGNYACKHAFELYPRAVATILFAFSEVEIRHSVLFYNVPKHVGDNIAAYSVDELAMIAKAYGQFQMVHLPLFDVITAALPTRVLVCDGEVLKISAPSKDSDRSGIDFRDEAPHGKGLPVVPQISSLVRLLEAYARLTIFEASVLNLLCDAIAKRRAQLAPALVVSFARSLSALSFAHPGLIEEAQRCLHEHGDELNAADLQSLRCSLEALGRRTEAGDAGEGSEPDLLVRPPSLVASSLSTV